MFQGGSLWAGLLAGGMSQLQDTKSLQQGQLGKKEYTAHTVENVTGAVGVMAGVEYGAVLGSTVLPGVGTVVGAVLGGVLGDRVGRVVGNQAGNLISRNPLVNQAVEPIKEAVQ
ncbi:glycine zipper domain-containing protein [Paenibacillus durus]|uniref:Glycine zipper domain-containing protein n=1 Tax=Paenibacillus durus ATCC 35681 TaxID=1333534 RepID=A0A0F7F796_PAEDU|nr:glycine zipper domain-containing protein [Paenibacillus durus]AKG33949.1 hypothetical protein VK70_04615 [Paenibacillus durus ATCC 35681]